MISRIPARRTVIATLAFVLWGVVAIGLPSCVSAANGARSRGYLTYQQFRSAVFTLNLPVVPASMVPVPPRSRPLSVESIRQWPYGLLAALGSRFGFTLAPGRTRPELTKNLLDELGQLGPARVYTLPHAMGVYWMYGQLLQRKSSLVPVSWVPFLDRMERLHRPYRPVRGPIHFSSALLPPRVPGFQSWAVAAYGRRPSLLLRSFYLWSIILVVHQNRLWEFFAGEPKDLIAPFSRVPTGLVPPPHDAVAIPADDTALVVRREFSGAFARFGLRDGSAVRIYHGPPERMRAWVRTEWNRLDSAAYGYDGGGTAYAGPSLHQQGGVLWGELQSDRNPTPRSQAGLYLIVNRQGWVAVAAGADVNR